MWAHTGQGAAAPGLPQPRDSRSLLKPSQGPERPHCELPAPGSSQRPKCWGPDKGVMACKGSLGVRSVAPLWPVISHRVGDFAYLWNTSTAFRDYGPQVPGRL